MKAIGYHMAGPIDRPRALVDLSMPIPVAGARDLTVSVHEHHRPLGEMVRMVDNGCVLSTTTERLSPTCTATVREAHARVENGSARGKIVIVG